MGQANADDVDPVVDWESALRVQISALNHKLIGWPLDKDRALRQHQPEGVEAREFLEVVNRIRWQIRDPGSTALAEQDEALEPKLVEHERAVGGYNHLLVGASFFNTLDQRPQVGE